MVSMRARMPKGIFEFTDNSVVVTVVEPTTNAIIAVNSYQKLSEALEHYKEICRKFNELAKADEEEVEEPKKLSMKGPVEGIKKKQLPKKIVEDEEEEEESEEEEEAISI